jgi:hypothetical protein
VLVRPQVAVVGAALADILAAAVMVAYQPLMVRRGLVAAVVAAQVVPLIAVVSVALEAVAVAELGFLV